MTVCVRNPAGRHKPEGVRRRETIAPGRPAGEYGGWSMEERMEGWREARGARIENKGGTPANREAAAAAAGWHAGENHGRLAGSRATSERIGP